MKGKGFLCGGLYGVFWGETLRENSIFVGMAFLLQDIEQERAMNMQFIALTKKVKTGMLQALVSGYCRLVFKMN